MTSERWRRIEGLYQAALAGAEHERPAFLAEACAGAEALLREVEARLARPGGTAGLPDGPALAETSPVWMGHTRNIYRVSLP